MMYYTYTTLSIDILMTTDKHIFNYFMVQNIIKTFELIKVIMTPQKMKSQAVLAHSFLYEMCYIS